MDKKQILMKSSLEQIVLAYAYLRQILNQYKIAEFEKLEEVEKYVSEL